MNVLPMSVLPLPDTCLLRPRGERRPVGPNPLIEPDVADYRHVAHHADVWRAHRSLLLARHAAELKVEMVKRQADYELAAGFRLERGEGGVGEFLVAGPVASRDAVQQALSQVQQMLGNRVGHRSLPERHSGISVRVRAISY